MTKLFIDFETRSTADIKKVGAWKYAADPSTEIMCMAAHMMIDDDTRYSQLFTPEDLAAGIPAIIENNLEGRMVVAHNAHFEYAIWNLILHRRHGWPALWDPKSWGCTLSRAAMCNLPISLDACGAALGISSKKDLAGRAAMLKLSRPIHIDALGFPTYREDADLRETMYDYCQRDVEAEMEIDARLPELPENERKIWELDLLINRRGVRADVETAAKAVTLADTFTKTLNEKLVDLTGGAVEKASRVAAIKSYLKSKGVVTESLDKAAVSKLLSDPSVSEEVKEVIKIRQQVGKSSTAKYQTILDYAGEKDNRMRGMLQYHAAGTGRWGGRGPQPQNFPKGLGFDSEKVVMDINNFRDWEFSQCYGDKAMDALSAALRGVLTAGEGKVLVAADYSAIEARVLMWLAADHFALAKYRTGVNLYVDMAKFIYNNDKINKKSHPLEYAVGKAAVLGCFTPETQVLTDSGWKRIIDVKVADKVWDGVEWVSHQGVICRGEKNVMRLAGIGVTPDHLILTSEDRWEPAFQVARDGGNSLKSAIALASSPLRGSCSVAGEAWRKSWRDAVAAEHRLPTHVIYELAGLLAVPFALNSSRQNVLEKCRGTRKSSLISRIGTGYSTGFLRRYSDAIIGRMGSSGITAVEVYRSLSRGGMTGRTSSGTSSLSTGGTSRSSRWTELTSTGAMSRVIFGLSRGLLMWLTDALSRKCKTKSPNCGEKLLVYDIALAGPRSRFTVLSDEGPLIVHNCGYGMGKDKFYGTCQSWGIQVEPSTAEAAVQAYRKKYKKVVEFWHATEKAARSAVRTPGSVHSCGGGPLGAGEKAPDILWGMDKRREFLVCKLPSGRHLRYFRPSLRSIETPYGEKEEIHYWCAGLGGKLEENKTYGGSLVENIVQGTARDIMANGMLRAEEAGFPVVLTVHDELVTEVRDGGGDVDGLVQAMCSLPKWADGCPIAAEGWIGKRYRK